MDPEMLKYFRKILNSFSIGVIWLLAAAMAGLYYRLAFVEHGIEWYNGVFYGGLLLSFGGLLWYYYRMWR